MPGREMVEAKLVEIYKFETQGAELSGHLLKLGMVKIEDEENAGTEKEVPGGLVITEDGQPYRFLLGYQLAGKLRQKHIGHFVVIRYETDKPIKDGQNPMKVFKVTYSKDRELDANQVGAAVEDALGTFQATDNDIPF